MEGARLRTEEVRGRSGVAEAAAERRAGQGQEREVSERLQDEGRS
jgi:hypothetical protein